MMITGATPVQLRAWSAPVRRHRVDGELRAFKLTHNFEACIFVFE